jgi:hypothetical protein
MWCHVICWIGGSVCVQVESAASFFSAKEKLSGKKIKQFWE